jgi:hypothetical protein
VNVMLDAVSKKDLIERDIFNSAVRLLLFHG